MWKDKRSLQDIASAVSSPILQFNCIPIDYDKYLKPSQNKTEYMKYMIAEYGEYGENEETTAIINYFGYTDFDNPRIAR